MPKAIFFLILSLLIFASNSLAENDTVLITDIYHCARLSDGKTHVVTLNTDGTPSLVKKGKALRSVNTQINVNKQRIKLFKELEEELRDKENIERTLLNRILKAFGSVGRTGKTFEKAEDYINEFGIIRAELEQKALVLQTYKSNVKACENNKLSSLDGFFVQPSSYYARGTLESRVGWILRIPKVNAKQNLVSVCLLLRNYNTTFPELRGKITAKETAFGGGPFCLGNSLKPADKNGCTGEDVQSPGQLTTFFPTSVINTGSELGPDPSSDLIVGLIAEMVSLPWGFKVLPISAAPGGDCDNLSEK